LIKRIKISFWKLLRPSLKRGKYKQTNKPIYGCEVNGFILKTVNEGLFVTTKRGNIRPETANHTFQSNDKSVQNIVQ